MLKNKHLIIDYIKNYNWKDNFNFTTTPNINCWMIYKVVNEKFLKNTI